MKKYPFRPAIIGTAGLALIIVGAVEKLSSFTVVGISLVVIGMGLRKKTK